MDSRSVPTLDTSHPHRGSQESGDRQWESQTPPACPPSPCLPPIPGTHWYEVDGAVTDLAGSRWPAPVVDADVRPPPPLCPGCPTPPCPPAYRGPTRPISRSPGPSAIGRWSSCGSARVDCHVRKQPRHPSPCTHTQALAVTTGTSTNHHKAYQLELHQTFPLLSQVKTTFGSINMYHFLMG
jgi:hypothetical protein